MFSTLKDRTGPFGLAVSGEAQAWRDALDQIVGPAWLTTYDVRNENELLSVVERRLVHAAVLDEDADWGLDVLQLLRQIRRLDSMLPVVVVTRRSDRRWLESALRLTAFSVVAKPLELEQLLCQIQRMMRRIEELLRNT